MKVTTLVRGGLQTDPGPFSGAPDSALVEAQNVVYDRLGLIEPRGGWTLSVDAVMKAAGRTIVQGLDVTGGPIVVGTDNASAWTVSNGAAMTGPTSFAKGRVHFARAKSRVLLTSEDGVCEVPLPGTGTAIVRAGLPQPSQWWGYVSTGAGNWLGNNQSVAYRFTLFRTLADGTTMESAPTAPLIIRNTSGGPAGVTFIAPPGLTYTPWSVGGWDNLRAGDQIRVYRAPVLNAATGVPSDVMRLRASLTLVSATSYEDKLGDTQWSGPELYTNTLRSGIGQARTRPGYARDMALYQGRMIYAGYRTPQRVAVTCKAIGDVSDPQQSICTKTITVTTTSGSVNLTGINAADIAYMAPGQWITLNFGAGGTPGLPDARFQVDTQIATVNVVAGTATLTKTALATGAISVTVWDWVGVTDGVTTYRQWAQEPSNTNIQDLLWLQAHSSAGTRPGGYATLEYSWNNAASRVRDIVLHATGSDEEHGQPEYRNVLMIFERASNSATTFAVKSSKPNAFDAVVDATTGIVSKSAGGNARIGVSVADIPDAVPEGNFIDIGDEAQPIYRVIVARSSLLIFKGDGIYQLFGNSPATYSVQLMDATCSPPATTDMIADWIVQRGDVVFVMSQRGPMRVSESGAEPIGGAIWETFRESFGVGGRFLPFQQTLSSGASPQTPYVMFALSNAFGTTYGAGVVFVYNVDTNAWTTWNSRRPATALWPTTTGQGVAMGYVRGAYADNRVQMGTPISTGTLAVSGDRLESETAMINSVVAGPAGRYAVTIAVGSEWTPEVGDVMISNPGYTLLSVVESVVSPTVFDVVTSNGAAPTAGISARWEEGYPIRVVISMRTLGTVDAEKRNVSVSFAFALRALLLRFTAYFQSAYAIEGVQDTEQPLVLPGWTDVTEHSIASTLRFSPAVIEVGVPQDVILDWGLRVGFTIQQARAWFSLGAVTMDAAPSGTRIGRVSR